MRTFTALLLLALTLWTPVAHKAHADEVTGIWDGVVSLRGNYYWERSTRVTAPAISAKLVSPEGVRYSADYLLDAISSASLATGVADDIAFTETRHDGSLGVGYEFGGEQVQLDVDVRGRVSHEPDYLSLGAGFSGVLSLAQRNTLIGLHGYYLRDDVGKVARNASPSSPAELEADNRLDVGYLDALSLGMRIDQILRRDLLVYVAYDLALLHGVQQNVYRIVARNDNDMPIEAETHPEQRIRPAIQVGAAYHLTRTGSTLKLSYRYYRDSWKILSHSPALRLYQELGPHLQLRANYRYYTQSGAFFHRPDGYAMDDVYFTADPKMTPFTGHNMGMQARVSLGVLEGGPLHLLHGAVIDFSYVLVLRTNAFGNGVLAQGGISLPF